MSYIQRINKAFKSGFIKNVLILSSGALIGQIIVVLASPLLTRLYSVESFGYLSVFTSISTILALLSTGRYELAIVLPKSNSKALKLIKLILCIGLVISLLYLILITLFKDVIRINDPTKFLNDNSAYILPIYVFFISLLSILTYWNQRKKTYKRITTANAVHSIVNTIISLILGFILIENGMIIGLLGSVIFTVIFYLLHDKRLIKKVLNIKGIKSVAKEYESFPQYMILSDLSLNTNQQLTPILFSSFYDSEIVGHYSLANRMLRLPNIIVTGSIANVFRNDAIDELRIKNNCKGLYVSTFKKLFLLSFPIYLTIFIVSPFIFKFIFGENWGITGEFGRIISTYLFVEFMANPLNTLFYVRNQQKKLMIIQTINLIMSIIMIAVGAFLFKDPRISLVLYSGNAILFNLLLLYSSYKLSYIK